MHTYIHTYTHTHIHTYTHICFFWPTQADQSNPHPARARSQLTPGGACSHRKCGSTNSTPPKAARIPCTRSASQWQGEPATTTLPQAANALPRLKPEHGTWHHAHFAAVPLMKRRGHAEDFSSPKAPRRASNVRVMPQGHIYIYTYICIYIHIVVHT